MIWDGGNNDFSFFTPDVLITVATRSAPATSCTITRAKRTCAWPT